MRVVSLKKSSADKKAEKDSGAFVSPDDDGGVTVHLSHHHLEKMGLGDKLKSGDKIKFRGHGHVEGSENRSEKDGERYSARLRLTHAGAESHGEPDADDKPNQREGRRHDLEQAYDASEAKRK